MQWETLRRLAAGYDCHQISRILGLDPNSVWRYLYIIRKKLGVETNHGAVLTFYRAVAAHHHGKARGISGFLTDHHAALLTALAKDKRVNVLVVELGQNGNTARDQLVKLYQLMRVSNAVQLMRKAWLLGLVD